MAEPVKGVCADMVGEHGDDQRSERDRTIMLAVSEEEAGQAEQEDLVTGHHLGHSRAVLAWDGEE